MSHPSHDPVEPPRGARRLVEWVVGEGDGPEVLGTLSEGFDGRLGELGRGAARRWYWRQAAGFALRVWQFRRPDRREVNVGSLVDGAGRDVRLAIRGLLRRPTYAVVAVLTLALGIAANAAILTLLDSHRVSRLPFADPQELVLIWETQRQSTQVSTVSPGNYWAWKDRARTLSDLAAFNVDRATISGDGPAERVTASVVTPNFFDVLGVAPESGGSFNADLVRQGDLDVVLLSHSLWVRRFGADPDIVGASVRLDGRPHRVLGVMPRGLRQPERSLTWQSPELWRPLDVESDRGDFASRYLRTVGRIAPGSTIQDVRVEFAALDRQLVAEQPADNEGRTITARTLDDYLLAEARPTLLMLAAAGLALLLIVSANVTNLALARSQERRREFAVRSALGSGRGRLVRQLLIEAGVIALLAASVGAAVIWVGQGLLGQVQTRFFSELVEVSMGGRVALILGALTLATSALLGVPVATSASSVDVGEALSEGGRGRSGGRSTTPLRRALIVGQVALATALLSVAVLLTRSFMETVSVAPGFEAAGRATFEVSAPRSTYAEADQVERFLREIHREVAAIPSVTSVTMVSDLPFTSENRWTTVGVAGLPYDERTAPRVDYHTVLPNYFAVMGIPVLQGTVFDHEWEAVEGDAPIVVNRTFAELMVPDGDAIGRVVQTSGSSGTVSMPIVAVVGDVLDDGFTGAPEPIFYRPFGVSPQRRMAVVAEFRGPAGPTLSSLSEAVARVDPDVPAAGLRTVESLLAETVQRPRAASLIGSVFAVLALVIAAAGIYGVLSYLVGGRTKELGIRAALGASSQQLVRMVVGESGRLLLMGVVLGWGAALLTGRALSGLLFRVPSWDPTSLLGATVLLVAVGTLAAWIPARRAARIDPAQALRNE